MIDLREPKFQWGQPVVAAADLYNDGSLPDDVLAQLGERAALIETLR